MLQIKGDQCLPLKEENLASVQEQLWEGRAEWYNIGLQLGLTAGTLDAIKLEQQGAPGRCFTEILKLWLRSPKLRPSRSRLIEALRAETVKREDLAEKIEKKYCSK